MTCFSRIPQKAKREDVVVGAEQFIDSEGLDCIIRPDGTDIYVYIKPGAAPEERFPVKDGTTFEFCGKIYYAASASGTVSSFIYKKL